MQLLPGSIRSGLHVTVRGEAWMVADVEPHAAVSVVTLRGVGGTNHGETTCVLLPFDRATPIQRSRRLRHLARRRVLETALTALDSHTPWIECRAAARARIDQRAWQLEPARAVLRGTSRVLLADAVGLGKTIQALVILAELGDRGLARRVLVLTPAALRDQWAMEIHQRFGMHATLLDHVSLAATTRQLPVGVNPWSVAPLIVSSIDLVKRAEVRPSIDRASFDLLIVDEAHHLTPGSARAGLVADLAQRTPFVVLVTATPHSGDNLAYQSLLDLGRAGDEPIAVFRRLASDVRPEGARRTRIVPIVPTPAERRLLDETLAYARAVWRASRGPATALVASVIARRACSSPRAALGTLERRLAALGGTPEEDDQPRLPWEEEVEDDEVPETVMCVAGLDDRRAEMTWLERLVILARDAAGDTSKLAYVRRLLERSRESVLIFSEYRDVATFAASVIGDVTSLAVLHGGQPSSTRRQVVSQFNEGSVRTLISTDAAGEGLNLHQRCRLVVTLEMPWNPLRLEQRIGRVDRLGQTRLVHVRHLVHRGSFEDVVAARLDQRRLSAAAAFEPGAATEAAIETIVLGDDRLQLSTDVQPGRKAVARRSRGSLRARIEPLTPSTVRPTPVYASRPAAGVAVRHISIVVAADLIDERGRAIDVVFASVRCALADALAVRRLTRSMVRQVWRDGPTQSAVRAALAIQSREPIAAIGAATTRFAARIAALGHAIEARHRDVWVQASLFDGREEQRIRGRQAVRDAWREHLQGHDATLAAMRALRIATPRLVAAWLEH